ncbi:MAG: serine/threonine protein kinase [Myxococcales bacterium]|nr:serine/threonine protein kinase [Myxococcales bacterium]
MADQRYRITDRLEAGGMAEVFRGEAVSVQGFKKQVAIKRVLPHLAQNQNFLAMFLDEARLGARLNHANIVSVFDIGSTDNTYFIVMEYVDGGNLKALIEAFRKEGRHFPLKAGVYICMEACRGLNYAHETVDDDNRPLHIVHRDVSPPNILLSRRGEVKLTDFGLAKATTQLEKTDPGVVKGKFSYLSPEAALGQEVDARTDVFALGVVLWEMLAGRRLFLGESDYETVKLVQKAVVPSLQGLHPEVDSDLDAVVQKALTRDPNDRYRSAAEFGDALAGYLFSHRLKVTSYDVADLVKRTLQESVPKKADQSIIDRLIQEELAAFTSIESEGDAVPPTEGSAPLSPDDMTGAAPLAGFGFENPEEWFSSDSVSDADGKAPLNIAGGWHESGMENVATDLAGILEGEDRGGPRGAGVEHPAPSPPQGEAPAGGGIGRNTAIAIGAAVFVAMLALGAGAAYFLGMFK